MSYCETHALAVGYSAPLLRDIALQAERGSILALIGPNGAGKSTLLKTLSAQLKPQGGAVLLDGQDLSAYTPGARARKLALMLPHTARTELTTCFEVAAAGRYPYTGRLGVLSAADREQVWQALRLVQADTLADCDFSCISDGQRQRVLLARAVCQQPIGRLRLQPQRQEPFIPAAAQNVADHADAEPLPGARHAGEHLLCFHGGLYQNGAARAAGAIAAVFLGGLAEVF